MAMPAHLQAWPKHIPSAGVSRYVHGFQADGTLEAQQIDWFRRQFLKLADKASSTKEPRDFLRLAFMATLKGETAFAADDSVQRSGPTPLQMLVSTSYR
jgi:hypothetical protein